jgi:5,10-methylene-tetrahydrofolate dehydrogenase/methenyl tetrahydrofolate cyclohydrolase
LTVLKHTKRGSRVSRCDINRGTDNFLNMSTPNQAQQDIGTLLVQVTQTTADVIVLIIQILYAFILSIGRLAIRKQPRSVRGDIVLVTGAGHGIGKELALLYASEGATVVIWDINEKNGSQTVKEIAQLGYPKAHFFVWVKFFRTNSPINRPLADATFQVETMYCESPKKCDTR